MYHSGINAFYDTSGKAEDQRHLATCALLGDKTGWENLECQWKCTLEQFGISYIHMTDLWNCNHPYEQFKNNEAARDNLLDTLSEIILKNLTRAFVNLLHMDLFERWDKMCRLTESGGPPFVWVVSGCAKKVKEYHASNHAEQPLRHVHECGDAGRGILMEKLKEHHGICMTMQKSYDEGTGEHFAPFEATDFIAWICRRAKQDALSGKRYMRCWEFTRELFVPRNLPERSLSFLSMSEYREENFLQLCLGRTDMVRKKAEGEQGNDA